MGKDSVRQILIEQHAEDCRDVCYFSHMSVTVETQLKKGKRWFKTNSFKIYRKGALNLAAFIRMRFKDVS